MARLDDFRPQMIFVSAGFDAHRDDELGQLGLVEADYAWITTQIKDVAVRHAQGRIVSCLEGGYNLEAARSQRRRPPARAAGMSRPFDPQELKELVIEFSRPGIVAELAILVGCLVAAWIVVRLIRGRSRPVGSVWFGNRIFDGVLFPAARARLRLRRAGRAGDGDQAGGVQDRDPDPAARSSSSASARASCVALPRRALGAHRRAQHLVAGLDRGRSLGHRRLADGSRRDGRRPLEGRQRQMTLRNVFEGAITAGIVLVLALWISAAIEKKLLYDRQRPRSVAAQDRRQCRPRVAALLRPAARVVGRGHRSHRSLVPRRRDRRRPRLRAAEDRRQLHQRLRHPRRAEPAHRRHGQGRYLRGSHHRHPHPLHHDPLAQRPRGDRPQRDADHDPGRELVARRSARAAPVERAGRLRQRRSRPAAEARAGDRRRGARHRRSRRPGSSSRRSPPTAWS